MAKKMLQRPAMSVSKTMSLFKEQTLMDLQVAMKTQRIWPTPPYAQYPSVNAWRRAHGMSYSTGEAANSFRATITNPDDMERVEFRFSQMEYLRYVDLGVGRGVKAEDVDRTKDAYYSRRYVTSWRRKAGDNASKSHRPAFLMSYRHLATRLGNFGQSWYGEEMVFHVLEALPKEVEVATI